jgi:raffinose/stachyose/melibiose transport system permease protein
LPLLIFGKENLFTLPMGIMAFQGQYLYQWQLILTFVTLSMIPIIGLYILGQKYIIAGLTGGAIKG